MKNKVLWKYLLRKGRIINFNNPKLFTEKIQWLKVYDCLPIKTQLADKLAVLDWVAEKIKNANLPKDYKNALCFKKIYGVYEKYEDIDFSKLPKEYVIKTNHGCNMQLLIIEGAKSDNTDKEIFDRYLKVNYAYKSGYEMQYKDIKPKIFTEEYIKNPNPFPQESSHFPNYRSELFEYLIYCFNGEPEYILFASDKRTDEVCCTMFDKKWNNLHFNYGGTLHEKKYPSEYEKITQKPKNFEAMLEIARVLSKDFKFVRVDLHNIDGKIYFGEMTFTPASGYMKFSPRKYDRILGEKLRLN